MLYAKKIWHNATVCSHLSFFINFFLSLSCLILKSLLSPLSLLLYHTISPKLLPSPSHYLSNFFTLSFPKISQETPIHRSKLPKKSTAKSNSLRFAMQLWFAVAIALFTEDSISISSSAQAQALAQSQISSFDSCAGRFRHVYGFSPP